MHWLGTDNGNNPLYLFYSGLFTVLVFAAGKAVDAYQNARRHNCHEPRCWRIGHAVVDDKGTLSCWHHHPEGHPQRGHIRRRYHLYAGSKRGRG